MENQNKYKLFTTCGVGRARSGEAFYFDLEDYEKIKRHFWSTDQRGYLMAQIDGKQVFMHRLIMNAHKGIRISHINDNLLDNRKGNLSMLFASDTITKRRRKKVA